MSRSIIDGLSLSFLRYDKGRRLASQGTVCRSLGFTALYLYTGFISAGCGSLALSFVKEADEVGEMVSDCDFVRYDSILYLPDGAVFSGYAAYDLLSE